MPREMVMFTKKFEVMKGEKNGIKCYWWLLKGHAQFAIRYSISLNILLFRNGNLIKERTIHSFSIQFKKENGRVLHY